jgi:hypothetical protein
VGNRVSKAAARAAAIDLLRIVAAEGSMDDAARDKAFRAGIRLFGDWADGAAATADNGRSVARITQALDTLEKLNPAGRKSLVAAVSRTIAHDGQLTVREAELLRAICASLDCPLPPILSAA